MIIGSWRIVCSRNHVLACTPVGVKEYGINSRGEYCPIRTLTGTSSLTQKRKSIPLL